MVLLVYMLVTVLVWVVVPIQASRLKHRNGVRHKWLNRIGWTLFFLGLLNMANPNVRTPHYAQFTPEWWGTVLGQFLFVAIGDGLVLVSVRMKGPQ